MTITSTRVIASVTAVLAAVVLGALVYIGWSSGASSPTGGTTAQPGSTGTPVASADAPDTHRLSGGDGATVTVVEFIDFECEVCAAVHPLVEDLRVEYAGQVEFAFRYFPMPGHVNSGTAALAVEAAAQQDQLEPMYHRMFETQAQWGEQQVSTADVFRGFADDLGLDLAAYDAAVADPATSARVQSDVDAGLALGVRGTPTFFVDDTMVELRTEDDLRDAIEEALAP